MNNNFFEFHSLSDEDVLFRYAFYFVALSFSFRIRDIVRDIYNKEVK